MLGVSFIDTDGGFTLRNYGRLFAESRQRQLMLSSALLGAGASALATLIGAPLGLLFARASFPLKRFLRIALVTPLVPLPWEEIEAELAAAELARDARAEEGLVH